MNIRNAALASLLSASIAALPLAISAYPHTAPIGHHHEWVEDISTPVTTVVLQVALKQRNMDVLQSVLELISNPDSLYYGQYLSLDDIGALTSPTAEAQASVQDYFYSTLQQQATFDWTYNKDFVVISAPSNVVNAVYNTTFKSYTHSGSGVKRFRTKEHVLPENFAEIADYIDIVLGINDFILPAYTPAVLPPFVQVGTAPFITETAVATDIAAVIRNSVLICADGSVGTDSPPCIGTKNPIVSVTTVFYPAFTTEGNHFTPVTIVQTPDAFMKAIEIALPASSIANITAQALYLDGTLSDIGYSRVPVALSPLITPTVLRAHYGVPDGHQATNSNSSIAVIEFIGEYLNNGDLAAYIALSQIPSPALPRIIGFNDPEEPGAEAELDAEIAMGVAQGVASVLDFSISPSMGAGWIMEMGLTLNNISGTTGYSLPAIISISYVESEAGELNVFGTWHYLDRSEQELLKLAARGVTVVASSGDGGASGVPVDQLTCGGMSPEWPASSPFVLSVGANFLTLHSDPGMAVPAAVANEPVSTDHGRNVFANYGEAVCSLDTGIFFTSGGGFRGRSEVYPIPEWQSAHVASYLAAAGADGQLPLEYNFNRNGRGYPDVSALGHNYLGIYGNFLNGGEDPISFLNLPAGGSLVSSIKLQQDGFSVPPTVITPYRLDGTSASAPTIASLLALVNDALLNAKLPVVGFVNPLLYALDARNSTVFTDVVAGGIHGNMRSAYGSNAPLTCAEGFVAREGWDPASGLGYPHYATLVELAMEYANRAVANRAAAGSPDIRQIMLLGMDALPTQGPSSYDSNSNSSSAATASTTAATAAAAVATPSASGNIAATTKKSAATTSVVSSVAAVVAAAAVSVLLLL